MLRFDDQQPGNMVHNRRSMTSIMPASPAVVAANHYGSLGAVNSPQVGGGSNKIPNFLTASSSMSAAPHHQPPSPGYFGGGMQSAQPPKTPALNSTAGYAMSPAGMPGVGGRMRTPSASVVFPSSGATPGNPADLSGLFCRRQQSTGGLGPGAMSPAPSPMSMMDHGMIPTSPSSNLYIAPEKIEAENWVIAENFSDDARSLITDRLRRCGDIVKTDFSLTANRVYVRFANSNQARAAITLFGSNLGTSSNAQTPSPSFGKSSDIAALFSVRPMDDMKFIENQLATDGCFDYKRISPVFGNTAMPKQLRFRRALSVSDEMGYHASAHGAQNGTAQQQSNGGKPNQATAQNESLINRSLLFFFGLSDQGNYLGGAEANKLVSAKMIGADDSPRTTAGLKGLSSSGAGRSRAAGATGVASMLNNDALFFGATFLVLILLFWILFN